MFFKTFLILFLVGFIIIANNNLNRLEHEVCFFKKVCFYPVGQLDNFSGDDQKRQIGVGKKRKREEKKFVEARLKKQKKKKSEIKCESVIVNVNAGGNFYINYGNYQDGPLSSKKLSEHIVAFLNSPNYLEYCQNTPFLVSGDGQISYGFIANAMAVLQKSGVPSIGMTTEAKQKKERKQKDRELVQQYNEYSFLSTQKKKQGSLKCGLVIIDVDVDGNFYINYGDDLDRPLSAEKLANRVVALLKSKDYMEYCYDTPFLVRGGAEIPYGLVVEAMAVLLKSGVVNVSMITKKNRTKKEREMEQKRDDTILKNVGRWFSY